jgi:hypothetical protein
VSRVRVRITPEVLRDFLRLPEGVTVIGTPLPSLAALLGAETDSAITLILEIPGAPEDATAAHPTYSWRKDVPDPVTLEGIWWYREDGSLIVPEPAP